MKDKRHYCCLLKSYWHLCSSWKDVSRCFCHCSNCFEFWEEHVQNYWRCSCRQNADGEQHRYWEAMWLYYVCCNCAWYMYRKEHSPLALFFIVFLIGKWTKFWLSQPFLQFFTFHVLLNELAASNTLKRFAPDVCNVAELGSKWYQVQLTIVIGFNFFFDGSFFSFSDSFFAARTKTWTERILLLLHAAL